MSEWKLLHCGKLFDGIHEELLPDVDILVEDNRIVEVGKHLACPAGGRSCENLEKHQSQSCALHRSLQNYLPSSGLL